MTNWALQGWNPGDPVIKNHNSGVGVADGRQRGLVDTTQKVAFEAFGPKRYFTAPHAELLRGDILSEQDPSLPKEGACRFHTKVAFEALGPRRQLTAPHAELLRGDILSEQGPSLPKEGACRFQSKSCF